jgi:hypothetical protein
MSQRLKPALSDSLAVCLGSMNYWESSIAAYLGGTPNPRLDNTVHQNFLSTVRNP